MQQQHISYLLHEVRHGKVQTDKGETNFIATAAEEDVVNGNAKKSYVIMYTALKLKLIFCQKKTLIRKQKMTFNINK